MSGSSRPVVAPCAHLTSSAWISSCGRESISAVGESSRPRQDCCDSACAAPAFDHDLAVEYRRGSCRSRWRARSGGSGARRGVGDDVDAVDVALLVAHQQGVALELAPGSLRCASSGVPHHAAAERDGELPAAAVALLAHLERIEVRWRRRRSRTPGSARSRRRARARCGWRSCTAADSAPCRTWCSMMVALELGDASMITRGYATVSGPRRSRRARSPAASRPWS